MLKNKIKRKKRENEVAERVVIIRNNLLQLFEI